MPTLDQIWRWTLRVIVALGVVVLLAMIWRVWDTRGGLPLMAWHRDVPKELRQRDIEALDWAGYVAAENSLFVQTYRDLATSIPTDAQSGASRYSPSSPMFPHAGQSDWNRSYVLEPEGELRGAVVLLHGLTDSPYSLRHLAQHYRERGFLALGIRLPAHGTVPAALTAVRWEDWRAASRLALREARRRAGPDRPLHIVGYSNGAALAVLLALDALEDAKIPRAQRLVLISPMIAVNRWARYADILGWPAIFPAFAHAAWIDVLPEYNPYKYNSFPVNGARQSSQLTREVQARLADGVDAKRMDSFPPVLAFQSVVDATVSVQAVVSEFFALLPNNGSELVLFDLDRSAYLQSLLLAARSAPAEELLNAAPRGFRVGLISNQDHDDGEMGEWRMDAGQTEFKRRALRWRYPFGVYSLSHVALPFPLTDGLYGLNPADAHDRGLHLGAIAPRGERGMLVVSSADLARMKSNPFFDYLIERVDEGLR